MAALTRSTAILSALALTGAATTFTLRQNNMSSADFSHHALATAEHIAPEPLASVAEVVKPKLPSNFVQFSIGQYKFSNARV